MSVPLTTSQDAKGAKDANWGLCTGADDQMPSSAVESADASGSGAQAGAGTANSLPGMPSRSSAKQIADNGSEQQTEPQDMQGATSAQQQVGAEPSGTQAITGQSAQSQATKPQGKPAGDVSECCTMVETAGFSSTLPVVVIDTRGQTIPNEPKINATLCTCSSLMQGANNDEDWNGNVGIEIRGSTSARDFEKKSWALELRDASGMDFKWPLLGFPKESDFALYGPEMDTTMGMRNVLTYDLSNRIGLWAPRTKYVEVFLIDDGAPTLDADSHYWGLYVLLELVKRDKNRVDIAPLEGDNLSGGYIWKHDNNNIDEGDKTFWTSLSQLFMVMVYPKKWDVTQEQLDWLTQYMTEVETAMLSDSFDDPFKGYLDVIDVDSFIDYFLIVEVTKNPDGYRGSTYMHKDRDGPLRMGPPWDYNEAYGMCCGYPLEGYEQGGQSGPGQSGGSAISTDGWRFNICADPERCQVDPQDGVSQWYRRLWQDAAYRERTAQRWAQVRDWSISDGVVNAKFDEMKREIADAARRNYARWKPIARLLSKANWERDVETLRSWTLEHLAWMDSELAQELAVQPDDAARAG